MEDEDPNQEIAGDAAPASGGMSKLGPLIFGLMLLLSSVGAFLGGGYLSLGPEGIEELFGKAEEEEAAEEGELLAVSL
ncbi:MAG: hypothetical protein AAF511_11300, partial [Pseudomonadota bacterium]